MTIMVTGGAGFIGSNYVRHLLSMDDDECIINLDKLTYAGNMENLKGCKDHGRHIFVRDDITNRDCMTTLFQKYQPRAIIHFAAESHVDRSIANPGVFIQTNIVGTFQLLDVAHSYWSKLDDKRAKDFRFLHVSTDEVYGSLASDEPAFTEEHSYKPNSPYSASKASADHLARSYFQTYGLPVLVTNCSNNYGPYQFPEKLIPLVLLNALEGKKLPIYGDGQQIRDWLYVLDHCSGISAVLAKGTPGEVYNIGGWNEKTNLEVVHAICQTLDQLKPKEDGSAYASQITFVEDRKGHDRRYAIDASKMKRTLGWMPSWEFNDGITATIKWYLDNQEWIGNIKTGAYRSWMQSQYGVKKGATVDE
jgi:dTDP-glucose 4,6-dehydratase